MAESDPTGVRIPDIARLYLEFSGQLEQIVRRGVLASDPVVEDACQFAWSRLVYHRARMREDTVFGWLVRTAIHEAFKLSRRRARDLSLDQALDAGIDPVATAPEPSELLALRERIASVTRLPHSSQRAIWLRALGLSHEEMAAHEHCTRRSVERQLARARAELRTRSVAA